MLPVYTSDMEPKPQPEENSEAEAKANLNSMKPKPKLTSWLPKRNRSKEDDTKQNGNKGRKKARR